MKGHNVWFYDEILQIAPHLSLLRLFTLSNDSNIVLKNLRINILLYDMSHEKINMRTCVFCAGVIDSWQNMAICS